tara:strand:- start:81 stop:2756 length:2676 start_codon:yes stop_codon:yes gene_type:complete
MKVFFETILDEIFKDIDLEKTYFIIPNRRSKIFLKKEILKKISSVSISPKIYSIDDFIEKVADIKESARTNQLFYLYESYMKVSNKKDFESYTLFRNWANTLLNDINDIDMGMANYRSVFKDLHEIHKLEAINDNETQKKLAFWSMIPKVVENFKSMLIKNNLASKGLCHVYAKENIEIFSNANKEFTFIFLGLNSLSNTEQYIINYILENNKCEIFWDCDDSFLENSEHEAGYFFRKYIHEWDYFKTNKFNWSKKLISSKKNISVYETTKQIAQVKIAANLIQEISKKKLNDKTAIILPNQELLTPLVSSLPESIVNLSISISNPVINMQLSKFAINFFEMYSRKKSNSFYYKDILNTLSSNYLLKSRKNLSNLYESIKSDIVNKNMVYVNSKYLLKELNNDIAKNLFNCTELNILDTLKDYIDIFETNINESTFLEQSSKIKTTLQIIKNFNSKHKFTISFSSLKDFFNDIIKNQSINFYGDPTHNFHIMGLLESRGMDFDNVIICSANEGILPSNNFFNSLIPFDLRKKHNLTTIIEDDARTSYDFYHLLLRAFNIHIIYNSVSEGIDTGEKSRYIQQLELLQDEHHNIKQIISQYPFSPNQNSPEVFEKTKALISRLKEIAEIGFSPSSLNRYIDNPINFFDEYVINVKSDEEVNEFPEARGIGIIFHNTMEAIYKPFTGKKVDANKLEISIKKIDKLLDYQFIEEYGKNYNRGKNMIIYKVLKNTIKELIRIDINKISKGIELKIIDIESKLEIDLVTKKTKIKYKLKGTVDRIQSENGEIKIIDYKTGSFEPYKLSFSSYQELVDKKKKEAFQLLCYCLMYVSNNNKSHNLNAGIISFKNLKSGLITLKKSKTEKYSKKELDEFKVVLDNVIEEIFDTNLTFSEN